MALLQRSGYQNASFAEAPLRQQRAHGIQQEQMLTGSRSNAGASRPPLQPFARQASSGTFFLDLAKLAPAALQRVRDLSARQPKRIAFAGRLCHPLHFCLRLAVPVTKLLVFHGVVGIGGITEADMASAGTVFPLTPNTARVSRIPKVGTTTARIVFNLNTVTSAIEDKRPAGKLQRLGTRRGEHKKNGNAEKQNSSCHRNHLTQSRTSNQDCITNAPHALKAQPRRFGTILRASVERRRGSVGG